jgi:hypothetical protein
MTTGSGLDDWIYWRLLCTVFLKYNQYSPIADLHTFRFTVVYELGFSVSNSRILATDLNTATITSNHYEVFLSFLLQSPWTADPWIRSNSSILFSLLYSHSLGSCFCTLLSSVLIKVKVKVKVTLRLAVYRQSVRLGVKPLEIHDETFFFLLNSCGNSPYVTCSLTRRCYRFPLYRRGTDHIENTSSSYQNCCPTQQRAVTEHSSHYCCEVFTTPLPSTGHIRHNTI